MGLAESTYQSGEKFLAFSMLVSRFLGCVTVLDVFFVIGLGRGFLYAKIILLQTNLKSALAESSLVAKLEEAHNLKKISNVETISKIRLYRNYCLTS